MKRRILWLVVAVVSMQNLVIAKVACSKGYTWDLKKAKCVKNKSISSKKVQASVIAPVPLNLASSNAQSSPLVVGFNIDENFQAKNPDLSRAVTYNESDISNKQGENIGQATFISNEGLIKFTNVVRVELPIKDSQLPLLKGRELIGSYTMWSGLITPPTLVITQLYANVAEKEITDQATLDMIAKSANISSVAQTAQQSSIVNFSPVGEFADLPYDHVEYDLIKHTANIGTASNGTVYEFTNVQERQTKHEVKYDYENETTAMIDISDSVPQGLKLIGSMQNDNMNCLGCGPIELYGNLVKNNKRKLQSIQVPCFIDFPWESSYAIYEKNLRNPKNNKVTVFDHQGKAVYEFVNVTQQLLPSGNNAQPLASGINYIGTVCTNENTALFGSLIVNNKPQSSRAFPINIAQSELMGPDEDSIAIYDLITNRVKYIGKMGGCVPSSGSGPWNVVDANDPNAFLLGSYMIYEGSATNSGIAKTHDVYISKLIFPQYHSKN